MLDRCTKVPVVVDPAIVTDTSSATLHCISLNICKQGVQRPDLYRVRQR